MFEEALRLTLTLTIENEVFKIAGANVKNFSVDLYTWGFDAQADFWVSNEGSRDEMAQKFITPSIIEARLTIQGVYNLPDPEPDPLILRGPVTEKSVAEETYENVEGTPVLYRNYFIRFHDPAQVFWKQHFPTALYVDGKMEDVIKSQVVQGISLTLDWTVLTEIKAMICLSLGDKGNRASFYDFMMWFVRSYNGVWFYDSKNQVYEISEEKTSEAKKETLIPEEIESAGVVFPETGRYNFIVKNAVSESPASEDIKQDYATIGVSHSVAADAYVDI